MGRADMEIIERFWFQIDVLDTWKSIFCRRSEEHSLTQPCYFDPQLGFPFE